MNNQSSFWESELASCIGLAIVILAVCLGIGGCIRLIGQQQPKANDEVRRQGCVLALNPLPGAAVKD